MLESRFSCASCCVVCVDLHVRVVCCSSVCVLVFAVPMLVFGLGGVMFVFVVSFCCFLCVFVMLKWSCLCYWSYALR